MDNIFIELTRKVDNDVSQLLFEFIDAYHSDGLSPYVASIYYKFILASYKVSRLKRYNLSSLSVILNKNNLPTNLLVNIYAHALYCLALYDGQEIYKEFIV